MKITRNQLRRIIRESVRQLHEADEPGVSQGDSVTVQIGQHKGKSGKVEDVVAGSAHVTVGGKLIYVDVADLKLTKRMGEAAACGACEGEGCDECDDPLNEQDFYDF